MARKKHSGEENNLKKCFKGIEMSKFRSKEKKIVYILRGLRTTNGKNEKHFQHLIS